MSKTDPEDQLRFVSELWQESDFPTLDGFTEIVEEQHGISCVEIDGIVRWFVSNKEKFLISMLKR